MMIEKTGVKRPATDQIDQLPPLKIDQTTPPNVAAGSRSLSIYTKLLQSYLSNKIGPEKHQGTVRSLQQLSVDKIVDNPKLLENSGLGQIDIPIESYALGKRLLFSKKLNAEIWLEQLEVLKSNNATIGGKSLEKYSNVHRVNTSEIVEYYEVFNNFGASDLVITSGESVCSLPVGIENGATVIGGNALVSAGDVSFRLSESIGNSVLKVEKKHFDFMPADSWGLSMKNREDIIYIKSENVRAGFPPLIHLHGSNFIGFQLDCAEVSQGIVITGGPAYVADNVIKKSRRSGIYVYNSSGVVFSNNSISFSKPNENSGVIIYKCEKIKILSHTIK